MEILTPKQKIVLQAMKEFFARNGKMPTVRELREEIGKLHPKEFAAFEAEIDTAWAEGRIR